MTHFSQSRSKLKGRVAEIIVDHYDLAKEGKKERLDKLLFNHSYIYPGNIMVSSFVFVILTTNTSVF